MMSNKWDGWRRCEEVPEFKHLFQPKAQAEDEVKINYGMVIASALIGAIVTWAICGNVDWMLGAAYYCALMGAGYSYGQRKGEKGMILAVVIGGIGALLGALVFHYAEIWSPMCIFGSLIGAAIGALIGATVGTTGDSKKQEIIGRAILGAMRAPLICIKWTCTGKIKWYAIGFGILYGISESYHHIDDVDGLYEIIGMFTFNIVLWVLYFTLGLGILLGLFFMPVNMIWSIFHHEKELLTQV